MNNLSEIDVEYTRTDLSIKSEICGQIIEYLDEEASHGRIKLTDHVGALPANLTGAMAIWYGDYIAGLRRGALDVVEAILASVNEVQGASGVFLERRLDQLADESLSGKRQALARHMEKYAALHNKLREKRSNYETAKREYDDLRARHGRSPKVIHWWYFLLLLIVGITDLAVNYDSILSTPGWDRPILAAGAAIVIAILLACAAHLHGTLLRQWGTRFGAFQDDGDRAAAWRMLGLGAVGLSVSLAAVWYFRSQFLTAIIVEQAVIGGVAPTWLATVGGSLTTNVAVWIIGVILAFLLHDPDPHFPEAQKAKDREARELRRAEDNFDEPIRREYQRIDAIGDRASQQAKNQDHALSHLAEYKRGRRLFEKVAQQDARVMAVLENYRGRLVNRLRQRHDVIIERAAELSSLENESITVEEYATEPLKIKYI